MFLDDVLQTRSEDATVYAREGGPGDISLDKSELIAIFIEAMFYGFEALTFVATVYLLHGAKRNKSLLLKFNVVIIMFLLNTIHIGTSLRRILNAFVGTVVDPLPDAAGYLADLAGFLYRFKNILIVIQTIILDIFVVYRCYMVWDRKIWVALVPTPSIIAYLATGIAAIRAFAVYKNGTIFTGNTKTWVSATLCITLLTKLVCLTIVTLGTVLPRPKSLWHSTYLKANRNARMYKAVLIGIESGGLAIIGALILAPVYLAGRNAQGILWGAMSPLTGESLLIIVIASLLGMTPSTAGASRRRKGTIPSTRVTIPPIPVSPTTSPVSRFSVPGTLFKSSSPSSVSPSTPSDYNKFRLPFSSPEMAYPSSRYSRGYVQSEPLPFSTAIATLEDTSREDSIRDALAYGGGELRRKDANSRQNSAQGNAFHIAHSADGRVEVFQKEHSAS